ncbi:MAG TPA: endonuclease [Dehalococcoidales bacterium]|nr:endonuclease [Dehalococcoidales bacterium]
MKLTLTQIYQILFKRYGPQHWWPAKTPFEVIVGAILTQSTAWINVEKAIKNLRKAQALTPKALRDIPEKELAVLIHSCGYYNVKARKLKAFVEWFEKRYQSSLKRMFANELISLREELLGVYGIGEETADSILLYAGGKPIFVIDAYTRRIVDRMGIHLTPVSSTGQALNPSPARGEGNTLNKYADYQKLFMSNLPPDATLFNEYHALLVRLGKEQCRKKPACEGCCMGEGCGENQKLKIKS